MKEKKRNLLSNTSMVCIIAFICCLLWGSAFPSIKIGYKLFQIPYNDSASQIIFAGLRFSLAGILVILIGSIISKTFLRPKKSTIPKIIILSIWQTILQYIFFYIGLANTSGVKASVIGAANVFFSIIISSLVFRFESFTVKKIVGCSIGFFGVVLINLGEQGFNIDITFMGEGFILISTIAYAVSSVLIKYYAKEENPVLLSGYQFAFGGIVMAMLGVFTGGKLQYWKIEGVGILLYLALVSAIAYTLWSVLLTYNPVSKVAVFGFMNPICGVLLSAILLGESGKAFEVQGGVALLLACVGIYIVNRQEK